MREALISGAGVCVCVCMGGGVQIEVEGLTYHTYAKLATLGTQNTTTEYTDLAIFVRPYSLLKCAMFL